MEREKAILGDDARQFATVEDVGFDDDDGDLLGGGMSGAGGNTDFDSQFPDITSPNPNEVCLFFPADRSMF